MLTLCAVFDGLLQTVLVVVSLKVLVSSCNVARRFRTLHPRNAILLNGISGKSCFMRGNRKLGPGCHLQSGYDFSLLNLFGRGPRGATSWQIPGGSGELEEARDVLGGSGRPKI